MAKQYPMTELVRTYLQQTGSKFFGPGTDPREEVRDTRTRRAQDLSDYSATSPEPPAPGPFGARSGHTSSRSRQPSSSSR